MFPGIYGRRTWRFWRPGFDSRVYNLTQEYTMWLKNIQSDSRIYNLTREYTCFVKTVMPSHMFGGFWMVSLTLKVCSNISRLKIPSWFKILRSYTCYCGEIKQCRKNICCVVDQKVTIRGFFVLNNTKWSLLEVFEAFLKLKKKSLWHQDSRNALLCYFDSHQVLYEGYRGFKESIRIL